MTDDFMKRYEEQRREQEAEARKAISEACDEIRKTHPAVESLEFPYEGQGDSGEIQPPNDSFGLPDELLSKIENSLF